MKKLFYLMSILFAFNIANLSSAALPNIVALVNDSPITLNEFQARKHMVMALNNIQTLNSTQEKQLDKAAIKALIDESLLKEYSNGKIVTPEEIDDAIENIEERNKMPKGYLLQFLKSQRVDVNSFRAQVESELLKMNILSQLSRSVAVSPKEIDAILLSTNTKDANILAQIYISKDKDAKTLKKMYNLQKSLKNCDNIKEAIYTSFATKELIEQNLSTIDPTLRTIINDLDINQTSSVFERQGSFQLVLVCQKTLIGMTLDDNNFVVNFLTNKKMSQKAKKLFEDLHKKAYIKVMLPK